MLHGGICQDSLLQFFLRVSKGAAGSARTASLLLHVTTHICLVLAVLRRLKERQVLLKQKTYTLVYPLTNPCVITVKPYPSVLPSTITNKAKHTGVLILNMTEQYWVILLKSISPQTCTASKCISTSLIIDVLMMVVVRLWPSVRGRINLTTQRAWPRFFCGPLHKLTCWGSAPFLLWFWMKSTRPCTTVFTATSPFSSCSHVGGGASGEKHM